MTKDEQEYEKLLKKMDKLKQQISDKKDILDKERDEAIIKAVHEINITREQGFRLANVISNEENLESILNLRPKEVEKPVKRTRTRKVKEREEIIDEE